MNRNIGKVLFQFEKTALLIVFMILLINISVNGLVVVLDDSITVNFFTVQTLLYIVLFSFVYLIIYAINQVVTAIPFLVSLNCPKKNLARKIIFNGFVRSFVMSLIIVAVKLIIVSSDLWLTTSIFGINITSGNIGTTVLLAGIFYLLLISVYSFLTFISLLGVKFGWEYVVTTAFIILGLCFLLVKSLVLLVVFGWQINVFIIGLLFIIAVFNFINYKLIKSFEYKN